MIKYLKNKKEPDYSWSDLGIPQEVVEEQEYAGSLGIKLIDPPKELVERTIEAVLKVREDKS
jgi:hypothetical protein